ncbi:MAG: nucleotidyltransferase domain-containing protein [Oscillospiraceae bacterium]|nr:nucleotidyltransferase domain-containing protein [Oscillospiraceae bacterium]
MEKVYSIDEIKQRLHPIFAAYPVYKATLFGSYARGDANTLSDLDIVTDSHGEISGVQFFAMWAKAEDSIEKRIDMVELVEIRKESPVFENIQREGVTIYDRN